MRAATFAVSADLLREVMHMPEGTGLRYAWVNERGELVLTVDHPDIPEDERPHETAPILTKHYETNGLTWDWCIREKEPA